MSGSLMSRDDEVRPLGPRELDAFAAGGRFEDIPAGGPENA